MNNLVLFFLGCLLHYGTAFPHEPTQGLRLIKTGELDNPIWFTQEEVFEKLIKNNVNFMDITDHQGSRAYTTLSPREYPQDVKYQHIVDEGTATISIPRMENFVQTFSDFNNRYYSSNTGIESSQWLLSQIVEAYESSNYNGAEVTIEPYKHSWAQESIIARIHGTDPELENEIIILGAHLDSVNGLMPVNGRSPGADDNGSGSVTLLETFRILMNIGFIPKRTIEFQWYAAEEVGLRGSQDIANTYMDEGKNVIGMSNFDVVGYTTSNTNYDIGLLTDYTDNGLNDFVRLVIDNYCTISKWKDYTCGYACSDHASWNSFGFAAISPSEYDLSPHMHTARDTIDTVNFLYVDQFVRIALGFTIELAEPADA